MARSSSRQIRNARRFTQSMKWQAPGPENENALTDSQSERAEKHINPSTPATSGPTLTASTKKEA